MLTRAEAKVVHRHFKVRGGLVNAGDAVVAARPAHGAHARLTSRALAQVVHTHQILIHAVGTNPATRSVSQTASALHVSVRIAAVGLRT